MKVAEKFLVKKEGKQTPLLTEEYQDYNYSQLVELTKMKNEEELEKVGPSKSVREIKKVAKEANEKLKKNQDEEPEIEGQVSILELVGDTKQQVKTVQLTENEEEKVVQKYDSVIEESPVKVIEEVDITEVEFDEKEDVFQMSGKEAEERINPKETIEKVDLFTEKELDMIIDSLEKRLRTTWSKGKEEYFDLIEKIKENFIPNKNQHEGIKEVENIDGETSVIETEKKEVKSFEGIKTIEKIEVELPEALKKVYEEFKTDEAVSRIVYYPKSSYK